MVRVRVRVRLRYGFKIKSVKKTKVIIEYNEVTHNLKVYSQIWALSLLCHELVYVHVRTLNPKFYSLFWSCVRKFCTIRCIANAPLTSMLKILSDPIINQTIGSSVQINRSLQLYFRVSCFLSAWHQINTK